MKNSPESPTEHVKIVGLDGAIPLQNGQYRFTNFKSVLAEWIGA
ncbi:MAG: hypothetical protein PHC45_04670 [Clostridiaceae bacterium]|nr:hypothetical protein [Clostridiaceae bacterium]